MSHRRTQQPLLNQRCSMGRKGKFRLQRLTGGSVTCFILLLLTQWELSSTAWHWQQEWPVSQVTSSLSSDRETAPGQKIYRLGQNCSSQAKLLLTQSHKSGDIQLSCPSLELMLHLPPSSSYEGFSPAWDYIVNSHPVSLQTSDSSLCLLAGTCEVSYELKGKEWSSIDIWVWECTQSTS